MQRPLQLLIIAALGLALAACAPKAPPLIPEGNSLRIGVVPFSQPASTSDLMAGYISEMTPRVEQAVLTRLDADFSRLLSNTSKRVFIGVEKARLQVQRQPKGGNVPALDYWLTVGRILGLDLVIVPQIHSWRERQGGELGASNAAAVAMDFFLLDVPNKTLLARSRYDEQQRPLMENLMDLDKFIKRGGQWVEAETLAQEGMYKAIKDFGL